MTLHAQNALIAELFMQYEDKSNRSINFGPSQHIGEVSGDNAQISGPTMPHTPASSPNESNTKTEGKRFFIVQLIAVIAIIGGLLGAAMQALGPYLVDKLKDRDEATTKTQQTATPLPASQTKLLEKTIPSK